MPAGVRRQAAAIGPLTRAPAPGRKREVVALVSKANDYTAAGLILKMDPAGGSGLLSI